jgi:hypothetical protein
MKVIVKGSGGNDQFTSLPVGTAFEYSTTDQKYVGIKAGEHSWLSHINEIWVLAHAWENRTITRVFTEMELR